MILSSRQIIDRGLFIYGAIITFIVTLVSFLNINTKTGLISFILFLPITLYFFAQAYLSFIFIFNRFLNQDSPKYHYFDRFRLQNFVNQSDNSFRINLTLLSLAISLILIRISLQIAK